MPRGFLVGRLFRTNIYVTPDFFLLLVFYFVAGKHDAGHTALFCIALIVSLLVHEFGHVAAVRWFLHADSAVILWGLGGLCVYQAVPDRPRKRVGISLMGPAFEAVLGGACLLAYATLDPPAGMLREFLWFMVWINLVWVGANLLPILPLDGGQALRAALEGKLGPGRSLRLVRHISVGVAISAGAVAATAGYLFASILCFFLVMQNLRATG